MSTAINRSDYPSRQTYRAAVRAANKSPIQKQAPSYASAEVIRNGQAEIVTVQSNVPDLPAKPVRITSAHNRNVLIAAKAKGWH